MSESSVKTLPFIEALEKLELPGLQRSLFSSPDWIAVLQNTYRLKVFVKCVMRRERVESYIIYSVVRNFLEWKICICSYCDYCDGYVQSVEDWNLFFESLRSEYPRYRIAVRNFADPFVRDCRHFKVLSQERLHQLDIRGDLEGVWKRTHDSFRAAVHQGERAGVVVKPCAKPELKKFYDLHLQVRKHKYHIFPQPYKFFDRIWRQYMERDQGVLLGAYDKDGTFIGGNVYLQCGNTFYYKFNTSSKEALKLRPNNLLFWEGIKLAKQRGMDLVDLGSSGCEQHGLILYKNHTGAQMRDITHLGYAPPDYKFSQKRILRAMTTVFTLPWMPDGLVKLGSRIIYPFLA